MNTNTVEMSDAKALAKKNLAEAAGTRFTAPTGSIGVILAEPSTRGKPQAELSCTEAGCTETHVREVSDWHQCSRCRSHAKKKGGSSGSKAASSGGSVTGLMKILDTDSDEIRQMKQEANETLLKVKEAEKAKKEAERALAAEARKAQQEAAKAQAEDARKAKAAEGLRQRLAKIKALAAERGVEVSAKTEAEASEG